MIYLPSCAILKLYLAVEYIFGQTKTRFLSYIASRGYYAEYVECYVCCEQVSVSNKSKFIVLYTLVRQLYLAHSKKNLFILNMQEIVVFTQKQSLTTHICVICIQNQLTFKGVFQSRYRNDELILKVLSTIVYLKYYLLKAYFKKPFIDLMSSEANFKVLKLSWSTANWV